MVIVNYFSHFPEVIYLKTTTSHGVINVLKSVFTHNGILKVLVSDNGL